MMRKIFGGLGVLACGGLTIAFATSTLSVGCGSSSSSGGTSTGGGGTTGSANGGGTSGGSTGSAAPEVFCDGFGLKDSSNNQFLVETYSFSGALKTGGCYNELVGYSKDAGFTGLIDGNSVTTVGGIWDVDQEFGGKLEGTGATPISAADPAIFPGGCDDMGIVDAGPLDIDGDGGMNFTLPTGAQTVASVVATTSVATTGPIVGVVTAVYPWTPAAGSTAAKSGSFYMQDPVAAGGTPAPGSGTLVYMNKDDIGSNIAPNRGDVVTVTGFTWSPYNGADVKDDNLPGYTNNQNQVSSGTGAAVTVIGTAPLPPYVSLTAAQLSPTGTSESAYYQMRVTVTGGPFTVDGTGAADPSSSSWDCPAPIETISTSTSD
jgi:hypothetical protein